MKLKLKKREILFARNWCFHDFNFKILHSSSFHPVFVGSDFVFFAIFGLGKVLWFCLTKVLGKTKVTQIYIGFIKIYKLVPKVVKKAKWQDIQEAKNPKILQNIPELKKFNSKCRKVF